MSRARCRTRTDGPRLTRSVLYPAELSGQFVVRGPADAQFLVVHWRTKSKHDLGTTSLLDRDSIDPVILGAIGDEEVRVAAVVTGESDLRIRSDALTTELHAVALDARGLALHSDELLAQVENEVVSMIDAEREKDPVPALDEFRKNDGFRSLTNVDRML